MIGPIIPCHHADREHAHTMDTQASIKKGVPFFIKGGSPEDPYSKSMTLEQALCRVVEFIDRDRLYGLASYLHGVNHLELLE